MARSLRRRASTVSVNEVKYVGGLVKSPVVEVAALQRDPAVTTG